ncbi:MAG: hypothetical protein ACU85E_17620, partial [Gammaproteobacteria bacterium]
MSGKSAWAVAYDITVGVVRVGTNLLAVPTWAGTLAGCMALFTSETLWAAAHNGFMAGLEWSFQTPFGIFVTLAFGILGIIHAIRLAKAESQYGVLGFVGFLLDNSWALPNTVLGSIFATVTLGK